VRDCALVTGFGHKAEEDEKGDGSSGAESKK
jgi:hypothetical protein